MSTTLIRGAWVFDGLRFREPTDVLIDGNVIAIRDRDLKITADEVIDGSGMTVLPGLIDCHTHSSAESLVEALAFGVTTEIAMGTDPSFAATMRGEQAAGVVTHRADLLSAGSGATAPGGHGTQYGPTPTLSSPDEAERFVAERVAEGSDFIKILWEPGDGTWPTLDEETIAAVVEAAHRHNRQALIHANGNRLARRSVELGVDGLAHLFADEPPAEDFGSFVAGAGVFVVPTLSVRASSCGIASGADLVTDHDFAAFITPGQARSLRRPAGWSRGQDYGNSERAVALLNAAGATVLAGTDAPNPGTAHGASLHRELELLARCGMTVEEALRSATSSAAETFGLSDRGVVQPGGRADLVLVRGDLSRDLALTRSIYGVWKNGTRFDREQYRDHVRELTARSAIKPPAPAGLDGGLIADFEDGLKARFGSGWSTTTDQPYGGGSSAELRIVGDGAERTGHSLEIKGEVGDGYLFPWAGATFHAGSAPGEAADLSSKKTLCFWARGDGGTYHAGIGATSLGFLPVWTPFIAGDRWSAHEVSFEEIGIDGSDIETIRFVCQERRGFGFQIDELLLR